MTTRSLALDAKLPEGNLRSHLAGYAALLGIGVCLFFVVRWYGESLTTAQEVVPAVAARAAQAAGEHTLLHLLLALVVIVAACQVFGRLFVFLGQPAVIGEVVAGIVLGPSLLGRFSPETMDYLLPGSVAPVLGMIAQIGVILYMFLVGLELDLGLLRSQARATVAISHSSIVVPFVMGATLALALYPAYSQAGVTFTSFALFMGAALSITAFPVLARILTDRKMHRTELGILALACAAADDVTAWCLLAFIVGVAQAEVAGAVGTTVLAALFVAFMFLAARPLAVRWLGRFQGDQLPRGVVAWVLLALLASALATEAIGIHAVFGAFLLGAIIPHDSAVVRVFHRKLEDIVGILLLPAFFAFTGLRTEIGLVNGVEAWLMCLAIILVATLGKFGGAYLAARWTGLERRPAAALGILMNTRGLMELIVLNIGLDLGVISPTLFAMMVLMALATTLATTPLLQLIVPESKKSTATVLDRA